jgi:glucose/arabinose dehydrogenase
VPTAAATAAAGSAAPIAAPSAAPRVLVSGLDVPWGIAFLPDGNALVTERKSARLLRVAPDGAVTPVGTVAGVAPAGEGGLLGIAVSPAFTTDRALYVFFTAADDNRVVRLQVAADGTVDGAAQQVVVSGIPKGGIHDGGGLAFGPDGLLYVGTGEAGRRGPAQDRADLGGKILRVTRDGAPAPGNPFGTAVYSYGHRNVQGLTFAPDGTLYAAEFGQNRFDEINVITAGGNYGWPEAEGVARRPGYVDPLVTWPTDDASPSGLAFGGGALWAAALRGERLWRVPVTGPGALGAPADRLAGEFGRLRAVAATPDGTALWVSTSNRDGRGEPAGDDDRILVVPLS